MAFVDGAIRQILQPAFEASARLAHDSVHSSLDLLHVDADRAVDGQSALRRAPRDMSGIGAGDEDLGGRASRVDAGSPNELAFD